MTSKFSFSSITSTDQLFVQLAMLVLRDNVEGIKSRSNNIDTVEKNLFFGKMKLCLILAVFLFKAVVSKLACEIFFTL